MSDPKPRLQALDGLRGLAIGAVLLHHAVSWTGGPTWVGGHHGVTLFFVLSGFLITFLLLAEFGSTATISLRWFYARRAARILPALGLALVASLVFSYLDGMSLAQLAIGALLVLFFAVNWAFAAGYQELPAGYAWTLAIEEQFYLVWPALLAWRISRPGGLKQVAILCLGAVLVAQAIRMWNQVEPIGLATYFVTFTRWDAMAIGCLVAIWAHRGGHLDRPRLLGAVSLVALLACLAFVDDLSAGGGDELYGYLGVELAAGVLIAAIWSSPDSRIASWLSWGPLAMLGLYSYGLYLWNQLMYEFSGYENGQLMSVWLVPPLLALMCLVAWLSKRFVEDPARRYVRRNERRMRSGEVSTDAEQLGTAAPS